MLFRDKRDQPLGNAVRLIYFRDQGPWTVDLMTGFWEAKVEQR
jgi:hypothetical protein